MKKAVSQLTAKDTEEAHAATIVAMDPNTPHKGNIQYNLTQAAARFPQMYRMAILPDEEQKTDEAPVAADAVSIPPSLRKGAIAASHLAAIAGGVAEEVLRQM